MFYIMEWIACFYFLNWNYLLLKLIKSRHFKCHLLDIIYHLRLIKFFQSSVEFYMGALVLHLVFNFNGFNNLSARFRTHFEIVSFVNDLIWIAHAIEFMLWVFFCRKTDGINLYSWLRIYEHSMIRIHL